MICDELLETRQPGLANYYHTLQWTYERSDGDLKTAPIQQMLRFAATCKRYHNLLSNQIYRQAIKIFPMLLPRAIVHGNHARVAQLLMLGANPNMRIHSVSRYFCWTTALFTSGHAPSSLIKCVSDYNLSLVTATATEKEYSESRRQREGWGFCLKVEWSAIY